MVVKFTPEKDKIHFINKYTMFHLLQDGGGIEVDFKKYLYANEKLIFLEKGQYIKFLSDGFVVRKVEFEEEEIFRHSDTRILFKHLVSLGYINFEDCHACQAYLQNTTFSSTVSDIIDISSEQWYWQNPFHATKEEYHLIFDIKDIIDEQFKNHLSNAELSELIGHTGMSAQALYKEKVGLTIKSMLGGKRLVGSAKRSSLYG